MYNIFMKKYLNLGQMSPVENTVPKNPHYFIPHQCVMRAQITTTKLRVVFDASSKTSTLISLNETPELPIQVYELNTVTYGTALSDSLSKIN